MSEVSVIGTGAMGGALVEALRDSGAEVTVWNRTRERSEGLSGTNVLIADSVAEALEASPLTIVAVSDHELARTLVEEAGESLDGRSVASTCFVTPDQARTFATAVSVAGGHYLDLSIPAYPSEVRSGSGIFLLSGDHAAYDAHRGWFQRIGRAIFVDDAPGAAYISEMALLLAYLPMSVGLLQGLRVCEQHDLPVEWFRQTVLELYPFHIRKLLDRSTASEGPSSTTDVEASVDVWGQAAAEYAAYLREMNLDSGMYDALHRLFSTATQAGRGDDDWTCIAEFTATDAHQHVRSRR